MTKQQQGAAGIPEKFGAISYAVQRPWHSVAMAPTLHAPAERGSRWIRSNQILDSTSTHLLNTGYVAELV